jgi:hypothetical protein
MLEKIYKPDTTIPSKPSYQGLSIGHLYSTMQKHNTDWMEDVEDVER